MSRPRARVPTSQAVVLVMAVLLVALPGVARRPAQAATASPRWVGITMPGLPGDLTGLDALAGRLGRAPGVAMFYVAWAGRPPLPTDALTRLSRRGITPEITWEPWDPSGGTVQPAYALARVTAGDFDGYLRQWATAARSWGRPLRLRFAHEMNGTWYPWAEGVNGNGPGSYVAAWRHVRAVFAAAGADNVHWIWSPNVPFPGSVPLGAVFPGSAAVDELALDGYNWADTRAESTWQSFGQVFGAGLGELSRLSDKPISLGEVGCSAAGGDKARWIARMWMLVTAVPQIRGLVWFNFDKEADWRLTSPEPALAAFGAGIPSFLRG